MSLSTLSDPPAPFNPSSTRGYELLRKAPYATYMTICFLLRRGLRRNLRVRNVTGASAILPSASNYTVSSLQSTSRTSSNLRVLLRLIRAGARLGALTDRMYQIQEFDFMNFSVVVNGAKRDK